MRGAGALVLLASGITLAGCGSSGTAASSCEITLSESPGDQPFTDDVCREWTGAADQVAARQQDCASFAGATDAGPAFQTMFSNGPCPRANIVGGCRNSLDGVPYIDWYSPPGAYNDVQAMDLCAAVGGTHVPPP